MIIYSNGNIFDQDVEAIVNPVNCKGVMGAGLAKQVKERYPFVFKQYVAACREGELSPGHLQVVYNRSSSPSPKYIINFATKDDWVDPSCLEYIESGIRRLEMAIRYKGIRTIAIPALGCGLGQLSWRVVKPIMEDGLRYFGKDRSIIIMCPR